MNLTRTDKQIIIDLEPNESFQEVEVKKRHYGGKSVQVWVKIVRDG
jgi:hypothetical protein